MQEEQDHQQQVIGKDIIQNHMMQTMIKGKRTKRQRQPSPLRLTMSTSSSSPDKNTTDNSGTTSSIENIRNKEEEEDMANCLILLAQGHHVTAPSNNNNMNKEGFYFYQCKTCNRCFPSFQALGGHRAGHKKPKIVNDHDSLTLQLSNSAMCRTSAMTSTTTVTKSKVHECSICGAEFSSGQALGGHMRRHRTSATINNGSSHETQQVKIPRNGLKLDLNLPAPDEDDERESKFLFQSKDKVFVFSTNSLVDCHY